MKKRNRNLKLESSSENMYTRKSNSCNWTSHHKEKSQSVSEEKNNSKNEDEEEEEKKLDGLRKVLFHWQCKKEKFDEWIKLFLELFKGWEYGGRKVVNDGNNRFKGQPIYMWVREDNLDMVKG